MSECRDKILSLCDIGVNYYLNHVWIVNLDDVKFSSILKVSSSLNNQGCVTIMINVRSKFSEIYDHFRHVISQISSCSMILIILTYNKDTSEELLLNILGYMRCCQMCLMYTGNQIGDAALVSTQEIMDMVGGLTIKFGYDDMDDISLNSGSMSNSLRFNCISWAKHVCARNHKIGILYVGWHLLSYIFGMELGTKMKVYEMSELKDPVEICKKKILTLEFRKFCHIKKGSYSRPNAKVKLGALFSWALINYDSIIVIGGYPCKELRRMHKYISNYSKHVVLIDMAFNQSGKCDSVYIVRGEWDFKTGVAENLANLNIKLKSKCIIIDDSWVPINKWDMLKDKILTLCPSKGVDVSIKFNWYTDSNEDSIWVNGLAYIMLTPGMNDSTESRLMLKHNVYGSMIEKKEYINMMKAWSCFTMAEQCFMFGFYFGRVIEEENVLELDTWELKGYVVVSLYALGNVCSSMNLKVLEEWSEAGVYYLLNIYTELNNVGNVAIHKGYKDIVYKIGDVMKLYSKQTYSLTVDKLYNILYMEDLPRRGFKLMGNLRNIKSAVDESNKRMLITNCNLPNDAQYQSSLFSFASRLKWITIKLRSNREIGMNTTYLLRFNIMSTMFGLDNVKYDAKSHALVLNVNKCSDLCMSVFNGRKRICVGEHFLESDESECTIEVSGHVLNLLMWEILEPGNLMLWLKQIVFYYKNLSENEKRDKKHRTEREKTLKKLWEDGYFIETSLDRLDKKWHSKIEMLLACAIAKEYWDRLLNLNAKQLDLLSELSEIVFEIFTKEIK